jgi:transcriptional regulator GlxA family with amidase domain
MEADLTLSIWLVLTPNVLLLDYAGPAEALRMARDMGARLILHTCTAEEQTSSTLDVGLSGLEPLPLALPANSLILVVGNGNDEADLQTAESKAVLQWLQQAPLPDTRIASICSGALLLAKAGHLGSRRCTTHHSLLDALQAAEPSAQVEVDRIFVDDGRVLTSAGITTGIDLALYLIEQYAGPELASRVARRLVMYQRRGPQDPQMSPWLAWRNHMHPAVHRAQDALSRDPARAWTLA